MKVHIGISCYDSLKNVIHPIQVNIFDTKRFVELRDLKFYLIEYNKIGFMLKISKTQG